MGIEAGGLHVKYLHYYLLNIVKSLLNTISNILKVHIALIDAIERSVSLKDQKTK